MFLVVGLSACNDPEQTATIEQAIAALDAARERISELEEMNGELNGQIESLIATIEADTCAADYADALSELRTLNNDVSTLQNIIGLKDFDIASKESQLEALNALYTTLSTTYEQLYMQYEMVLEDYTALTAEYLASLPPTFTHIDGFGNEMLFPFYILFEYEKQDTVDFQISYLSNTSSPSAMHYMQVAYVQINKADGSLQTISYGDTVEGLSPGTWADYNPMPNDITYGDFETSFIPWLIGKTATDLEGISVFTNELYYQVAENTTTITEQDLIDQFAGSSVSTNNMIRVMKSLLEYYDTNYNTSQ